MQTDQQKNKQKALAVAHVFFLFVRGKQHTIERLAIPLPERTECGQDVAVDDDLATKIVHRPLHFFPTLLSRVGVREVVTQDISRAYRVAETQLFNTIEDYYDSGVQSGQTGDVRAAGRGNRRNKVDA